MPKERFYTPEELTVGQNVALEEAELHHLANVMRATVGTCVELVNGKGSYARAEVTKMEKKRASLSVKHVQIIPKENKIIILAQALPRLNRLDFIVEKGTELGMDQVWLFPGELSERKSLSESQEDRLKLVAIAAMKQCGRLHLPEIKWLPPIKKWEAQTIPIYFGSLEVDCPSFYSVLQKASSRDAIFCVGPEAGFSEFEEKHLQSLNGIGVQLHRNILRTDTAALVALALLTHT